MAGATLLPLGDTVRVGCGGGSNKGGGEKSGEELELHDVQM